MQIDKLWQLLQTGGELNLMINEHVETTFQASLTGDRVYQMHIKDQQSRKVSGPGAYLNVLATALREFTVIGKKGEWYFMGGKFTQSIENNTVVHHPLYSDMLGVHLKWLLKAVEDSAA